MFEKFNVPGFYLSIQGLLSLYASGRETGFCLESGDGVTQAVPVHEGKVIPHAIEKSDFAGGDLTESMRKLLN